MIATDGFLSECRCGTGKNRAFHGWFLKANFLFFLVISDFTARVCATDVPNEFASPPPSNDATNFPSRGEKEKRNISDTSFWGLEK